MLFLCVCLCKAASRKLKEMLISGEAPHTDSSLWTEVSFCVSVALSSLCRYRPKATCFPQLAGCKASLCLSGIHNFFHFCRTLIKEEKHCPANTQLVIQKPLWREVQVVPPLKCSCVSVVRVGNQIIHCLHVNSHCAWCYRIIQVTRFIMFGSFILENC